MIDNRAPICQECRRACPHYDADRGWSCCRKDCPATVRAEDKQQRYNEACRLAKIYRPFLYDQPTTAFTVGELAKILGIGHHTNDSHGFDMREMANRLGCATPAMSEPESGEQSK